MRLTPSAATGWQSTAGRGTADTLGVTNFPHRGLLSDQPRYFQGGGPSSVEVSAAAGSYTAWNSTNFHLVGDTADGGLSLGGTYVAPPFTLGINAESTGDTSPALTGSVTDPAASVTVRVNGSYYAAINNCDGTWTLPRGDISTLGTGSYNVVAVGVNTAGTAAFAASTMNQLSVASTSPTVAITAPTSPTVSPVSSIAIHFSEPVENFTLQDLQLTLTSTSGGAAASEPLEGAKPSPHRQPELDARQPGRPDDCFRHVHPDARRPGIDGHRYVRQSARDQREHFLDNRLSVGPID